MIADELNALLDSRSWVKRRIDRVEFLDLTTVRRTIVLTVDLEALSALLQPSGGELIPLGWFAPWANAGALLVDADERVIPYLTSEESDKVVELQLEARLRPLKITRAIERIGEIRRHREDPGIPGCACEVCKEGGCERYLELMTDKWGCRAVRQLLEELQPWDGRKTSESRELTQILLAWQTNFVLLAPLDSLSQRPGLETLRLSFDEELRDWEPPWERRKRVLKRTGLTHAQRKEWRRHISRGGPFEEELDALLPRWVLHRLLVTSRWLWLRKASRRGMLGVAWHVAWHQASGMDAPSHQVDVILPNELTAVRMRMMRTRDGETKATVADQVGSRATIVAPEIADKCPGNWPPPPPPPTLFSLVITQRSPSSWYGGAWIALLTGIAILLTALLWLPLAKDQTTDAITILIVAPTLVATLLSVRAGSEIAEQLTTRLRRLIGSVGVLAASCAIGLIAHVAPANPKGLEVLWFTAASLLLCIGAALSLGACRIRRLLAFGRRSAPRLVADLETGKVLNPDGALQTPPPDRWLASDEGELVPWGWLDASPHEPLGQCPPYSDERFWQDKPHATLVKWVQEIFHYGAS